MKLGSLNKGVIGITRMVVVKYLKACCCRHTFLLILVVFSYSAWRTQPQINQHTYILCFLFSRFSHLFFCSWRRDLFSFFYILFFFLRVLLLYFHFENSQKRRRKRREEILIFDCIALLYNNEIKSGIHRFFIMCNKLIWKTDKRTNNLSSARHKSLDVLNSRDTFNQTKRIRMKSNLTLSWHRLVSTDWSISKTNIEKNFHLDFFYYYY